MKRKVYNYLFISTAIISLYSLSACNENNKTEVELITEKTNTPELFTLKVNTKDPVVTLPAEIVADKQFDVYAKVLSYVKTIKADIGTNVKKGDILIELEAPEINSQLSAIRAKIKAHEAVTEFSKTNYQRLLEASETKGIISQDALDKLKSKRDSDIAMLESLRSDYESLTVTVGYLTLKAPFSGIVTERNTDIGALVGPSAMNKPLMVIQDNVNLRVRLSVTERYAPYVNIGDSLSFSVRSLHGSVFSSDISRKSGALDSALRSELIESDLKNTDSKLLPGMIADVSLKLKSEESTYMIPTSALAETNTGMYIMVISNGKTKKIMVRKVRENGMMTEIAGELKEGAAILKNLTTDIKEDLDILQN